MFPNFTVPDKIERSIITYYILAVTYYGNYGYDKVPQECQVVEKHNCAMAGCQGSNLVCQNQNVCYYNLHMCVKCFRQGQLREEFLPIRLFALGVLRVFEYHYNRRVMNKKLCRIVAMVMLLAGICLVTYYFHVILKIGAIVTHFFYIPIILASLWWRKGGIIIAAFLAIMLIVSRNYLRTDVITANDYFRAAMFLVIAVVVAILSEQYAKAKGENLDYQDKLRSLASELSLVEEQEKRRIAVEMHDHFGQDLSLSRLKLEELKDSSPSNEFTMELDKISVKLKQNIKSLRSLTFELCSPTLYELGFEKAVNEWLVERIQKEHDVKTEFNSVGQLEPLDENISVILFQVVRELLVNVIKHAQASFVKVTTEKKGDEIKVVVQDDGVGFNPCEISLATKKSGKLGLFSVRERIGYLGGKVEIESTPARGSITGRIEAIAFVACELSSCFLQFTLIFIVIFPKVILPNF